MTFFKESQYGVLDPIEIQMEQLHDMHNKTSFSPYEIKSLRSNELN